MVKYGHFDFVTLKWDDAVMQYKHFSIEFKSDITDWSNDNPIEIGYKLLSFDIECFLAQFFKTFTIFADFSSLDATILP